MIAASGLLSFKLGKRRARSQLENNEPLRSMPIYHGLYVSLWTILPSIFLLILFFIFFCIYFVTEFTYLSESIISLGLDEIIYVKSFLINNIANLTSLVESEFLSNDKAKSLSDKYSFGRIILFSLIFILSVIVPLEALVRFDARRKVENIFQFIF